MCRLHPRSAGMPSARLVGAWRHACTPNAVVMDEAGAAMFAFCVNKFHFRPAHPPFIRDLLVGVAYSAHTIYTRSRDFWSA